ncbi:hypothetical protein TNIN_244371 [Trichonephila inaurata madagascariensis]|uniref:Uncharacterized protein n=1 Tax=Trichonephila inaurata madagascariensis TaxID=2747483 RepID=A0A8X6WNB9_9ARAC|nr:hypothetical protein TNIN_244371 [Trichonephila inaurata madagascariensis]
MGQMTRWRCDLVVLSVKRGFPKGNSCSAAKAVENNPTKCARPLNLQNSDSSMENRSESNSDLNQKESSKELQMGPKQTKLIREAFQSPMKEFSERCDVRRIGP